MKALKPASVHFICGKGGVGKTIITAARGVSDSRHGGVLCVTIDQPETLAHYLGRTALRFEPEEIQPGIWAVHLDRQKCLDDFIVGYFKFGILTHRILDHPVYPYISTVVPGIREYLVLDRIRILARPSPSRPWHTIIVDTPATGHGLHLFNLSAPLAAALKLGPLRNRIIKTEKMLKDPDQSRFTLVTIPAETPVQESLDFADALQLQLDRTPHRLIINRFEQFRLPRNIDSLLEAFPRAFRDCGIPHSDIPENLETAVSFIRFLRRTQNKYMRILRNHFLCPEVVVPFFPETDDQRICREIARVLRETEDKHAG